MRFVRRFRFALIPGLAAASLHAQAPYRNHAALSADIRALAAAHAGRAQVVTIATSPGGRAVEALRIGAGADVATRPALLVVANAYGIQLIGSEVALHSAKTLLEGYASDAAVKALLDKKTIWYIPRLNPDAAESQFGPIKGARVGNDFPRGVTAFISGQTGRDRSTDLNRDGWITSMRIADPAGDMVADSIEPMLLRRADANKNEVGKWLLIPVEGQQNTAPVLYGQEGPGGTDINSNFPHAYTHHGENAGIHTMSEPESAGLAEFMIAHPQIAAVYVLGPQENLYAPWQNRPNAGIADSTGRRAQEGTSAGGPLNSIVLADFSTFDDMSRRFTRITGITASNTSPATGDLLSYFYYVSGRWAFGSRVWTVPMPARDPAATGMAALNPSDALTEQRNQLRWLRANNVDAFVPWGSVTIPGETRPVEVGGFKPSALWNPPAGAEFTNTLSKHEKFITALAGMLPSLSIRPAKVEVLGEGVYRVTAEILNEGVLPTVSSVGNRLRPDPRGIRLVFNHGTAVLHTGTKIETLGALPGGGRVTRRVWTLTAAPGTTVTLSAESPIAGSSTQTITLR